MSYYGRIPQRLRQNARFADLDHKMLVQIPVEEGANLFEHQKLKGPLSPIGRYGAQVPQGCPMGPNFLVPKFFHTMS